MSNNPFLAAALKYAADGYHVFPCAAGTKIPVTKTGFKEATTDEAILTNWWKQWPDANPAVYLEPSNVCVVDLDEWAGLEEWDLLEAEHGHTPTFTVRTPRGGVHLWFRGILPPTQHKLGSKIDTRGRGSYVLVPPAITRDGAYNVENNMPMAGLPVWVREQIDAIKKTAIREAAPDIEQDQPQNIARAIDHLRHLAPVTQGDAADARTLTVACRMRDLGLSEEKAVEIMLEHYDCSPQDARYPAFIERKVHNAYRYAQNAAGVDAVGDPKQTFATVAAAEIANRPPSKYRAIGEKEMDAWPEPQWLIPDLIPAEENVILYGRSGSYKSFIALDLALSIASSTTTFAGKPALSGPVFYVAMEGKVGIMTTRRKAWKQARGVETIPNFYVMTGPSVLDGQAAHDEFLGEILKAAAGAPVRWVVLDTGARVMAGANENDARDAGQFVKFCDDLRDALGCGVCVLMHSGKDEDRGIRGSSAFFAGFDTVINLETQDKDRITSVGIEKHKDAEHRTVPWRVELVEVGASLVPQGLDDRAYKERMQRNNPLSELNVARALQALQAGIEGKPALSTHAFASNLTPRLQFQTEDDHERLLKQTVRNLDRAARDRLAMYTQSTPGGLVWRVMPLA